MAYRLPGSAADEQFTRQNSVDQMTPPATDVNGNGKRHYNLGKPAFNTDAAQAYGSLLALNVNQGSHTYTGAASTTFQAIDTTNMTVGSFTAIGTQVLVVLHADYVFMSAGTTEQIWCLFNHGGTTQVGYHVYAHEASTAAINVIPIPVTCEILVTGLTIGNSYQFDWAWAAVPSSGGVPSMNTGSATSGVAAATDYGAASMKVFAG